MNTKKVAEKNNSCIFIHILPTVAFLCLVAGYSIASAKDFEARRQLNTRSQQAGIDRKSIELLRRLEGPGRDSVMKQIIERFEPGKGNITTQGAWKLLQTHEQNRVVGDGWRLRVWGDGTRFSYTNQNHYTTARKHALPLADRLSNEKLEKIGRQFIKTVLTGWVILGKGEELIPLYTEFEISGGISGNGQAEPETVLASAIHFGRRINGIDVVGPGSHISIYLDNLGKPFDFDVDWPSYKQTGELQEPLQIRGILDRLETMGKKNRGEYSKEVLRMECGYFDGGLPRVSPIVIIQAGCLAYTLWTHLDAESGTDISTPIIYHIPAGDQVESDTANRTLE